MHLEKIKKLTFLYYFLGFYIVTELLVSYAYWRGNWSDFNAFEGLQETIKMDKARGQFLTENKSRMLSFSHGRLEYMSEFKGNNWGFSDPKNFSTHKKSKNTLRFALFGSSFSAGLFLKNNIANEIEKKFSHDSKNIEVYNFSVDGAGFETWSRIIQFVIAKKDLELDGLIFSMDHLSPNFPFLFFMIKNNIYYAGSFRNKYGKVPQFLNEETPQLKTLRLGHVVDSVAFEKNLNHFREGKFKFYILNTIFSELDRNLALLELQGRLSSIVKNISSLFARNSDDRFANFKYSEWHLDKISNIKKFVSQKNLPVMVVFRPLKENVVSKITQQNDGILKSSQIFSTMVNGKFVDGRKAFEPFPSSLREKMWFRNDGHWNQYGSDVFAAFLASEIESWIEENSKLGREE